MVGAIAPREGGSQVQKGRGFAFVRCGCDGNALLLVRSRDVDVNHIVLGAKLCSSMYRASVEVERHCAEASSPGLPRRRHLARLGQASSSRPRENLMVYTFLPIVPVDGLVRARAKRRSNRREQRRGGRRGRGGGAAAAATSQSGGWVSRRCEGKGGRGGGGGRAATSRAAPAQPTWPATTAAAAAAAAVAHRKQKRPDPCVRDPVTGARGGPPSAIGPLDGPTRARTRSVPPPPPPPPPNSPAPTRRRRAPPVAPGRHERGEDIHKRVSQSSAPATARPWRGGCGAARRCRCGAARRSARVARCRARERRACGRSRRVVCSGNRAAVKFDFEFCSFR